MSQYIHRGLKIPFIALVIVILLLTTTPHVFASPECLTPAGTGCGIIDSNIFVGKYCVVNGFNCYFIQNQARACTAVDEDGELCCSGPNSTTQINLCLTATPNPASVLGSSTAATPPGSFSPFGPVTNETFDSVNPLLIAGGQSIDQTIPSANAAQLSTPGGIISRALTFVFPLAGLVLFVLLVWGGFEMLVGSPTKKSMDAGKQRITAAIAGFFLLFAAYWIWQIIEIVFGVVIF